MYFPDLSPCRYYGLSVGWLEKDHAFARGTVPDGFLERLLEQCRHPVIRHGGVHLCEFCPTPEEARAACVRELPNGERVVLGSGVIRVHPRQGLAFVAPTLVFHYIQTHGYLPPETFVEAVMEDNTENAETAAARYRHGARHLSRMLLGLVWLRAIDKTSDPKSKSRDPNER